MWSMINVLELIIGGVIALALQHLVLFSWEVLRSRKGHWHGTWFEVIPAQHGLPERWDKLVLKQNGMRISGRAWRLEPADELHRKWRFEGYSSGERMIGFFFNDTAKGDVASYIPVTLVLDKSCRTEAVWRGHYTWPSNSTDQQIVAGDTKLGVVYWQRSNPIQLKHD